MIDHPNFRSSRPGFSLIEVMAAMVIMALILVTLGSIFSVSQESMDKAYAMSSKNAGGRAAIDYMARELSMAIVDEHITLAVESDTGSVPSPDAIAFAAILNYPKAANERALKQICYYIESDYEESSSGGWVDYERAVLRRAVKNNDLDCIDDPGWAATAAGKGGAGNAPFGTAGTTDIILDHVRTLEIWVYPYGGTSGTAVDSYRSERDGPPAYIELYIEVMSEKDARQIDASTGAFKDELGNRAVKRYFRRVYLDMIATENLGRL